MRQTRRTFLSATLAMARVKEEVMTQSKPYIAQTKAEVEPFLTVPFSQKDRAGLKISEGFIYSEEERPYHPQIPTHFGLDFKAKQGTLVLAPADGLAMASFHLSFIDSPRFTRQIGFGIGRFVIMWHPKQGVYTIYCHLGAINRVLVPFVEPEQEGEGWNPRTINQPVETVIKHMRAVKRGHPIGTVGYSGLTFRGDGENPESTYNRRILKTWDPAGPHLHTEMFTRPLSGRGKTLRFDPAGIEGTREKYANFFTSPATGWYLPNPETGFPLFAG